jgi:phosphate transport system substrate-binding protein
MQRIIVKVQKIEHEEEERGIKKGMKKILSVILAAFLMAASLCACSVNKSASSSASGSLSGTIQISGSSALQPLAQAAADKFKETNPDVSVTVNAGGSGTGLQNISDKTVDIGDSDVYAEEKLSSDKAKSLVDHIVCVVGVAAVANPQAGVSNVTKQQLTDIFTGKITNWKEVGGNDQKIVIINRPKSSGTRALFQKYALGGEEENTGKSLMEDNSGTLRQNVAQTSGSVAYIAFSYLNDSVKPLYVDNVQPTYENIYSGKYNIWGYEHMYTNGQPSALCKAFLDYVQSKDFAKTITEKGYGLYSEMKVKRSSP